MHHFFVRPEQISGKEAYIEGPDWNHAANVLRVRPGEQVLLSAGEDWDYLCTVREVDRAGQRVLLSVLEENRDIRELPVKISLYQGLPKSDKMELIIQKAVELGAARVIPVETARCVVKLDRKKAESKRSRWQAISESAAKQSGRSVIPEVAMPMPFAAALKDVHCPIVYVCNLMTQPGETSGMTQLDHLKAVQSGHRLFAGDAHLPENNLRMLAGDRIIVDDQDAHFMGMGYPLLFSKLCLVI